VTLAAHGLAIGYRDRPVGEDIDVALEAGSVTCLLGPNGSGKTTLLRTLLGLLPARASEVRIDDRPIASLAAAERARHVAYVPQAAESHFDFTVRELVEMGRTAHAGLFGAPSKADRDVAQRVLEHLGIAHLAERSVSRVSGGERQLALVARALATEAPTLVMDEPTANLDFANQSRVLDEVARLRLDGRAVLFTTHHPDHALRVADRAILLLAGRVLASGPVAATVNSANLSALYGRPVEVLEVRSADGAPAKVCVAR